MALYTYQKVEKSIAEAYDTLSDPEDKRLFFDYIMVNFKLWIERFETELLADIEEPEIPNITNNANQNTRSPKF